MSEWRDIASAPKDGTRILAYDSTDADDTQPQIVAWLKVENKEDWFITWDHTPLDGSLWNPPTHWMPIPKPPVSA